MSEAISRDEIKKRLHMLKSRSDQWKQGSYRAGFREALVYAIDDVNSCRTLEQTTVTECHECAHALEKQSTMPYCTIQNRTKDPDDYCKFGEPDE